MATESFGLSQPTVSQAFIEESSKVLEEFERRDLGLYDFISLILDGKYLARENIVIALGITITGVKVPLGFIQTSSENSKAVKGLLKNMISRNFRFSEGILTVIDGSKGLRKALEEVFGEFNLTQRCQWHKREDVVSYLREEEKEIFRGKLQRAYSEPNYETAKSRLLEIRDELKKINRSAVNPLEEGLEETLTIHRLGLRRIKRWINPEMKSRWIATALIEIECKMRRVNNYKKLHLLRTALKTELKLKQKKAA